MIEKEHTFRNTENINIFYHEWLPDRGDSRGIVFIVHGHSEHSGRYRHVAESLTQAGLACYGIDHRGHGKSGGLRVFIPDMRLAVGDLRQLFDKAASQYPNKPLLMFGHSMGSLIALEFVLRYQDRLRGLALSAAAITGEESRPGWLVAFAVQAAKIIPKVRLSLPGPADVLTSDAEELKRWQADPLINRGMWRLGTSAAMVHSGRRIRQLAHQLTLPLFIIHGGDDRLAPVSGSTFLAQRARSDDLTIKIYEGLRHEPVNEVGRDAIIKTLTNWLAAHCHGRECLNL